MKQTTVTLAGELTGLLLAAPALYFPNWFPRWAPWLSLALLVGTWLWRRVRLHCWFAATPADWPLFFLFAVMLPIAVWAAPEPLRAQYALPRALILLWNFCLFYTVATYASHRPGAVRVFTWGMIGVTGGIALLAPLGINWLDKFGFLPPLYNRIPSVLRSVFTGAESGFSTNQVAGTLLFVLPLLLTLVVYAPSDMRRRPAWWLAALLAVYMIGVMVLTQSRSGLLGLGVGLAVAMLLPQRWGRRLLAASCAVAVVAAPLWWQRVFDLVGEASAMTAKADGAMLGAVTLLQRQEIWSRALYGIQDFSFTGMGLGTFRSIMPLLYPLVTMSPEFDAAHAHNFFLQTALDFGVPGLLAVLAIYLAALAQLALLWRTPGPAGNVLPLGGTWRIWATGLLSALTAQTVYSQFDAVAMGSKPNFLLWYLLALVLGAANWTFQSRAR